MAPTPVHPMLPAPLYPMTPASVHPMLSPQEAAVTLPEGEGKAGLLWTWQEM